MRKKTFLKLVSLFACFSILMLSVPGAIASERSGKKFDRPIIKKAAMLFSFFPFLNLKVDKDSTSNKTTADNSGQKIKITGGKVSVKGPMHGDS